MGHRGATKFFVRKKLSLKLDFSEIAGNEGKFVYLLRKFISCSSQQNWIEHVRFMRGGYSSFFGIIQPPSTFFLFHNLKNQLKKKSKNIKILATKMKK